MRRSELLDRIGANAPCTVCHLPLGSLTVRGKGDAAFLLPALAQEIWEAPGLDESDRVALNDLFSRLLQCSRDLDDGFATRLRETMPKIFAVAAASQRLREMCAEFFAALGE